MKNPLKSLLSILLLLGCSWFSIYAQEIKLTGVVLSATDKEPLIGVSVTEDINLGNGTVTDFNGAFSLSVKSSKSKLNFSYVGYNSQSVTVNNQTNFSIELVENTVILDEVVAIGYGTVKKSDLTGAVSSIKGKDITNTASAGIDVALQGKIPGVFINKRSGKPGETADIKIRGVGSFGGSGPLWIIDGVPQNPGVEFNMNDAESVEILRDGSAAAIYGAMAANGVVIITTKRAKKGDAKINFNSYVGFNKANIPNMLTTRQLKELRIEDFNGLGKMTEEQMLAFPAQYTAKDIRAYALDFEPTNVDYNWKDILFKTGITQNYDLSFTKGMDNNNYYASFNYFNEKGTYFDTGFKRYSFRLNSDVTINKWLTFGENMQIGFVNNNLSSNDQYLNNYMRTLPFLMPYDETNQPGGFGYFPKTYADGTPIGNPDIKQMLAVYDGSNVLADEITTNRGNNNFNFSGNAYAKIQPFKELVITARVMGGVGMSSGRIETGQYWYYDTKKRLASSMSQDLTRSYSIGGQLVANYNKMFAEKHDVVAMIGMEGSKSYGTGLIAGAINMLGNIYQISLADPTNRNIQDRYSNSARLSYFGRINYTFDNRYLFMALVRRDGYDRFGPENRWGTFPSFSAAWRISNEKFIADNQSFEWLSDLKLRASWGILGNSGIPQFLYTSSYIPGYANYAYGSTSPDGNQTSVYGLRLNQLPNHSIKWEDISTTDFGLDMSLFKHTLLFSFDWYVKQTSDALFRTSLPGMVGMGKNSSEKIPYILNVGKIQNTGFDIDLTYRNKIGKNLNYSFNTNFGAFKNKVLATDIANSVLISGPVTGGNVSYTQSSLPMGTFFGYQTIGVFQTSEEVDSYNQAAIAKGWTAYQNTSSGPGDLIFKDVNNDGHIDSNDITNIGSPWPDFTYGFSLNVDYKWLDFSVLFQGVQGNDIYNDFRTRTHTFNLDYNSTTHILNRWTGPGSTNKNFKLAVDDPNQNEGRISSWYVEDGSYLRLKNIQLGVTLPKSFTKKLLMSSCRFYVSAQNLLTFTKYEGFDPEFASSDGNNYGNTGYGIDTGFYPQGKTMLMGLQIEF